MPIQFRCSSCNKKLRVSDASAGKKAKCPRCSQINRIPTDAAAPVFATVQTGVPEQQERVLEKFYVDSVAGQTFGPVELTELANWVDQGRVSANCMIRSDANNMSRPAYEYFPQLGQPSAPVAMNLPPAQVARAVPLGTPKGVANPYATPSKPAAPDGRSRGRFKIRGADAGQILSYAWEVYKQDMGLILGASLPLFIGSVIERAVSRMPAQYAKMGIPMDDSTVMIYSIVGLVLSLLNTYLMVGLIRFCLRIATGREAAFTDVFSGLDKTFHLVVFYLAIGSPVIFVSHILSEFFDDQILIAISLLVSGLMSLLMLFMLWPGIYLLVDDKAGLVDSFTMAPKIVIENAVPTILLMLASLGITLVGIMALCIGVVFTNAFLGILWTVAYLMMTNQVDLRRFG